MPKYLRRSQINTLLELILKAGITSKHLILSDEAREDFSVPLPLKLSIQRSHFYFAIEINSWGTYSVSFFPSDVVGDRYSTFYFTFKSVCKRMSVWANEVAKELREPEPWSLLDGSLFPKPELFNQQQENQKFNGNELNVVHESLWNIRQFLAEQIQPSPEHLKIIDERLSFLEQTAKTESKKQWMYVAIGVVVTIADGLVMSPDQAHNLFAMLSDLFKHLFVKLLS